MADAVKVGNSWVSQAALDYAKTQVNSDTQATLKDLSVILIKSWNMKHLYMMLHS